MNILEARNHPLVEYARQNLWGSGITTTPEQFEAAFDNLSSDDQQLVRTFFTAATTSCPVPLTLVEDSKYGPAYLEKRYTSIDFWYRYLKEGPLKYSSFGSPVDLTHLGGRGRRYDQNWIPVGREYGLVGPSTYEGHILPRLIIDVIDYSQKYKFDVTKQTFKALDLITGSAHAPLEAIAALALYMNDMSGMGFSAEHLKKRLFDEGYQQETPEDYWRPIFEYLSEMLPEDLHFHD